MRGNTAGLGSKGHRRSGLRRARGFTLIELLVATAVFMFGLSGIMVYQVAAAQGAARASDMMMATSLVVTEIESLRNSVVEVIKPPFSSTIYYNRNGYIWSQSGSFFILNESVTQATPDALYYDIAVKMTWQANPLNPFPHVISMQTRVWVA